MKKRKRYRAPDGADWRDPNMPCPRDYTMRDGSKLTSVDPDYEHRFREHIMGMNPMPSWRNDPTYNLRPSGGQSNSRTRRR